MTPAQANSIVAPDLFPLLCQAWGESDRPCAFIAYTETEVRKFIVNEWWGDDTDERVDEVLSDLRGHDWKDEPEWHAEFEIGGVSFKPVYESNSRAAVEAAFRYRTAAPQASQPLTDEQIMALVDAHTYDDHGYDIWTDGRGLARAIEAAHGIGAAQKGKK